MGVIGRDLDRFSHEIAALPTPLTERLVTFVVARLARPSSSPQAALEQRPPGKFRACDISLFFFVETFVCLFVCLFFFLGYFFFLACNDRFNAVSFPIFASSFFVYLLCFVYFMSLIVSISRCWDCFASALSGTRWSCCYNEIW